MLRSIAKLILIAALPALLLPQAAAAQDVDKLKRKVERMEKQVRALQRKVFPGGDPRFFEAEGPETDATEGEGTNIVADMQVRLSNLERQLMQLTGRVEELSFSQRRIEDNLKRMQEDSEFRFAQLEERTGLIAGADQDATADGGFNEARIGLEANVSGGDQRLAGGDVLTPAEPETEEERTTRPQRFAEAFPPPEGAVESSPPRAEVTPRSAFDNAFQALRQGDYASAEQRFETFLDAYPQDQLASNAQYWLGRTYFVQRNYTEAAKAFLAGYQEYPEGEKAADSLLDLGLTLIELGQNEGACDSFMQLENRYPDASQRIKSRMESARAQAECG